MGPAMVALAVEEGKAAETVVLVDTVRLRAGRGAIQPEARDCWKDLMEGDDEWRSRSTCRERSKER